jgi:triphosphoribosyl-dephospho-CoA synthase
LAALSYRVSLTSPREQVHEFLRGLTTDDTRHVFEAIRIANPGGLGSAPEQDVHSEPTVTLLDAMKLAADRDMVARQYANGFADVFDFGVPAFLEGFEKFGCVEAAIIHSQLRWLAAYPDSLIARKNGPAIAADVQQRAVAVLALGGLATPEGRKAGVALDKHLRSDGNKLNPGTTADLITACLFVALRENKVTPSTPFRWQVDDWL